MRSSDYDDDDDEATVMGGCHAGVSVLVSRDLSRVLYFEPGKTSAKKKKGAFRTVFCLARTVDRT